MSDASQEEAFHGDVDHETSMRFSWSRASRRPRVQPKREMPRERMTSPGGRGNPRPYWVPRPPGLARSPILATRAFSGAAAPTRPPEGLIGAAGRVCAQAGRAPV